MPTKTYFRAAAIALAMLALAGCESHVTALLRLRDIMDAIAGNSPQPAILRIALEVPSAKECEALIPKLAERAKPYGLTPQNKCSKEGMSDFIRFRSTVPVSFYPEEEKLAHFRFPPDQLFAVFITRHRDLQLDSAAVAYNRDAYDRLARDLKSEDASYSFGFDDMKLSLDLENDTRQDQTIRMGSAFVDGRPVPLLEQFTMKPRQTIEARYSDVRC